MTRNTLSAAALAACALILSPMSFAEESPAFAARFAALQEQARNATSEQTVAGQSATESQAIHTAVVSE
ncbi:hypothetical protein D7241_06660 [Stutzerimonas sp. VN223-3]|uniref:hypothetical protein n=1 Tax=Stutzerimonas sp. VN223-3 TaxID=3384601 RepID=UPI0038B570EA